MTARRTAADAIAEFYAEGAPPRLGVAVSGGSDSLGLLHALADWGGAGLHAVTVDHGLRPDSAAETLHVARLCEALGIAHSVLDWTGWDRRGNLQDQARRGRYALMAALGRDLGLGAIALGHTLDDQAETVLMRLARASGVDGLSGMAPRVMRHGMRFDRPLLRVRRDALRDGLRQRKVRWVEDPSNADPAFDRVAARRQLALLEPLGITAGTLAEVAANMAAARDALARTAARAATETGRTIAGDLLYDRCALRRQPGEIVRRLLAGGLQWVSSSDYPPRRAAVAGVLEAVRRGEGATLHGCRVLVGPSTVRILREHAAVADLRGPTDALWDGRWRLDGPHAADLEVRALGEAVGACRGWRETGMPRPALLASPAIWRGETLVAAPVAGLSEGWTAKTGDLSDFAAFLLSLNNTPVLLS